MTVNGMDLELRDDEKNDQEQRDDAEDEDAVHLPVGPLVALGFLQLLQPLINPRLRRLHVVVDPVQDRSLLLHQMRQIFVHLVQVDDGLDDAHHLPLADLHRLRVVDLELQKLALVELLVGFDLKVLVQPLIVVEVVELALVESRRRRCRLEEVIESLDGCFARLVVQRIEELVGVLLQRVNLLQVSVLLAAERGSLVLQDHNQAAHDVLDQLPLQPAVSRELMRLDGQNVFMRHPDELGDLLTQLLHLDLVVALLHEVRPQELLVQRFQLDHLGRNFGN